MFIIQEKIPGIDVGFVSMLPKAIDSAFNRKGTWSNESRRTLLNAIQTVTNLKPV